MATFGFSLGVPLAEEFKVVAAGEAAPAAGGKDAGKKGKKKK